MQNFNTNQARHLYVAKALKDLAAGADPSEVLTEAGDIAVRKTDDGVVQLCYMNGDGIVTRSDAVDARRIEYVNSVKAKDLAVPLRKATVTVDADLAEGASKYGGESFRLIVDLLEYSGPDYSERHPVVLDVTALVKEVLGIATDAEKKEAERDVELFNREYPFTFAKEDGGLSVTEKPQKWVRDKLCADPIHFEVRTSLAVAHDEYRPYGEPTAWGSVEWSDSGDTLSGDYRIADLECFTHRERSEALGRYAWPDDFEWTPMVQPKAGKSQYGMLTVQYFYRGKAEDVQKSPKTLQVAAPDGVVESLKAKFEEYMEG